jgi:hypothetical protein
MDQGFYLIGEVNLYGSRSESECESAIVTWIRPEAGRSNRGQAEVFRKENGGPNRCCVHALE